ncbi:SseB family protein [Falsarthrobacter nasiphocae]|uniref:SseB protein N-terminal domain-containing protein n=1 Tax=Falsarthrobacter nasiphocae TaxID=189863 RepID=A0AAE4C6L3_9MICC|nr:SseB family protein [Falsarthrobacter nasiphocae]MDR6892282.1 hypothetical protein [Falsarthrobacter nasiphocae]
MTENIGDNAADQQTSPSTSDTPVSPANPLEEALAKGQDGTMEQSDVILTFLNSTVILLSVEDPEANPDANLDPVALSGPNDEPMVAVFSDPSRVPAELGEQAPYGIGVQGATVVQSVGEGVGIMLNPGFELGFMIEPSGVQMIRTDFRPASEVQALQAEQQGTAAAQTNENHPVRPTSDPAGF